MTTIAGPGKEVSEKSLELNVCAELLLHIRLWRGCERALWLGLAEALERRKRIDDLLQRSLGLRKPVKFTSSADVEAPAPAPMPCRPENPVQGIRPGSGGTARRVEAPSGRHRVDSHVIDLMPRFP